MESFLFFCLFQRDRTFVLYSVVPAAPSGTPVTPSIVHGLFRSVLRV